MAEPSQTFRRIQDLEQKMSHLEALKGGGGGGTSDGMEARVAVLEEIASATKTALDRLDRRMDGVASEMRDLRSDQRTDFRWLMGIMLGTWASTMAIMAHGFHWF